MAMFADSSKRLLNFGLLEFIYHHVIGGFVHISYNNKKQKNVERIEKYFYCKTYRFLFTFSSWMRRYWFYVENDFRNFHQIFTF